MAETKVTQKELADKHTYSREGLRNKVDRLIVNIGNTKVGQWLGKNMR